MESRGARVARGFVIAMVAVVTAAFSHVAAGGAEPGALGTGLALVFAILVCIALAGRRLSAPRLIAAVTLSQFVFHVLFSLGAAIPSVHGHSVSMLGMVMSGGTETRLPALASPADVVSLGFDDAKMWLGHALVAAATIVVLLHGERALFAFLRVAHGRLVLLVDVTSALPGAPSLLRHRRRRPWPIAEASHRSTPFSPLDRTADRLFPLRDSFSRRDLIAGLLAAVPLCLGVLDPRQATCPASGRACDREQRDLMNKRTIAGTAAILPLAGLLVLAAPLAASAHVHVSPETAPPGDYATLAFKVPTESATASTVKLEVDFPSDHPFTSVEYQPIPGWTAVVSSAKLPKPVKAEGGTITTGVTKVVWTADAGQGIAPGAFQQFVVSAGAVPDTEKVLLPATQTYSDGSVVKWNEPTPASGTEPEHPAPTLYINEAAPADPDQGIVATTATAPPVAAGSNSESASSDSGLGLGFGIGGLGLGLVALIVALLAYVRSSRAVGGSTARDGGSRAPEEV